jgi:Ca-activated chloride channel family protein
MHSRLLLTCTALSAISIGLGENSVRANADLVLVPVTVLDHHGATVTGLVREHFTILQDNIPQTILSFARQEAACSVGVIVDTSGSMYRQLDAAKSAVRAFLETAEARDNAFSMTFAERPAIRSGFTPDITSVWNSIQPVRARGSTALLDTLYLALSRMRAAHNPRRALLVVSDGMDNHSRYSKSDLMRIAMEANAQIYYVSIGVPASYKPVQAVEEHDGSVLLDTLADKTGGLHFSVEDKDQASQVAAKIGQALRTQYVVGYRPQDTEAAGKWHRIRVRLDVPKTVAYARSGYYSR